MATNDITLPQPTESQQLVYQTKDQNARPSRENQVSGCLLSFMSATLVIITFPLSLFITLKVVKEYERAIIFRLCRIQSRDSTGIFIPCTDHSKKVDFGTNCFDVPPQDVPSIDSVTINVDAVIYFRISDAIKSVANANVENAHHQSTIVLAQTTLRNMLGTKNLHDIPSIREGPSSLIQNSFDSDTDLWGIKVKDSHQTTRPLAQFTLQNMMGTKNLHDPWGIKVKDAHQTRRPLAQINLRNMIGTKHLHDPWGIKVHPVQILGEMATEVWEAISAESEQKALRVHIFTGSPAALQLRYLQTFNSISAEKNSTIISPRCFWKFLEHLGC